MGGKGVKEDWKKFMRVNGRWKLLWVGNGDGGGRDLWKRGLKDKGWEKVEVGGVWESEG